MPRDVRCPTTVARVILSRGSKGVGAGAHPARYLCATVLDLSPQTYHPLEKPPSRPENRHPTQPTPRPYLQSVWEGGGGAVAGPLEVAESSFSAVQCYDDPTMTVAADMHHCPSARHTPFAMNVGSLEDLQRTQCHLTPRLISMLRIHAACNAQKTHPSSNLCLVHTF